MAPRSPRLLLPLALGLALGASQTWAQGQELDVVAPLPREAAPGNVAVTPDGRVILSLHPFWRSDPDGYRVVELRSDGSTVPFPSEAWAKPTGRDGVGLNQVLGLRSDGRGVVWLLDDQVEGQAGKLVAWDTRANRLARVIYLPRQACRPDSFLNDLAVDLVHQAVFIADPAGGENAALLVVDLKTGLVRRVLEGHGSVRPEKELPVAVKGRAVQLQGKPALVGVDPITIDPANQWLYFGPMSGSKLYKARTKDLLDVSLSDEDLGERVLVHGERPICDGITCDGAGNIYVTSIGDDSVGVIRPSGKYEQLHASAKLLSWPDGMAFGPGNQVYVVSSQLHRSPFLSGEDRARVPFWLTKFPALAAGAVGR